MVAAEVGVMLGRVASPSKRQPPEARKGRKGASQSLQKECSPADTLI